MNKPYTFLLFLSFFLIFFAQKLKAEEIYNNPACPLLPRCISSYGIVRVEDGWTRLFLWPQGQEKPLLVTNPPSYGFFDVMQFLEDSGLNRYAAGPSMDTYGHYIYCPLEDSKTTVCLAKVSASSFVRTRHKDRPLPAGVHLEFHNPSAQEEAYLPQETFDEIKRAEEETGLESHTELHIASIDFDGSGRPGYAVVIDNEHICGMNSCMMAFWQKRETGWKNIGDAEYTFRPVFRLDQETNGYHDIYVDGQIIHFDFHRKNAPPLYYSSDPYEFEKG